MMLRKIIFSIWCLFLFIGSGYSQNTASLPYWTQILPKSSISSNDSCAVFDHATLKWKKVNCYELGDGRFVKTTGDTVTGNLIFSDANEGIVFTSGGFLKSDGSGSTLSDGFNNYIELDGDVYIADQTGCNIDLSSSGVSIYDAANSNSIQLSNAGVGIFNNFSSGLHLYTTDNNLNGFGNQLIQQSTGTTISGPNIALTTAGDYTFDGGSITASRVPYIDASKNLKTSSVTNTELGYVSGVTSGIQSQLNAKQAGVAVSVSSAGTLSITSSFSDYIFSGTTATWTLPTVSGNGNIKFFCKNRGSGIVTINSNAGGNDIYFTSAISSFSLNPGDAIILINDTTYWNIE